MTKKGKSFFLNLDYNFYSVFFYMRSLKRLGAAFFATSMLCTINVVNAKIFVGTSQVAESVNLIDKDLIESQNNELIAGISDRVRLVARIGKKRFKFLYDPKTNFLTIISRNTRNCKFLVKTRRDLKARVFPCIMTNGIDERTQLERALVKLEKIIFR